MSYKSPKESAKMICNYLKKQPGRYAPDPKMVQKALNLSEAEFKSGLDYCVERKIIVLEKPEPVAPRSSPFTAPVTKIFTDDFDEDEVKGTAEVAAITP